MLRLLQCPSFAPFSILFDNSVDVLARLFPVHAPEVPIEKDGGWAVAADIVEMIGGMVTDPVKIVDIGVPPACIIVEIWG